MKASNMSFASKRSESSASRRSLDMDTLDDGDDRDESKRKSRNLSEKKRRDQFNILINELCSMVTNSPRKMDKSTVLKATIAFLKAHNELAVQSQVHESREDWKPSFLSNEEFTHLMMESLDGFIIVISCTGQILYLSESITSLLGHLNTDLVNRTIYDYVSSDDQSELQNILLSNPTITTTSSKASEDQGSKTNSSSMSVVLNFRIGGFEVSEEENFKYQLIKVVGYFKKWVSSDCGDGRDGGESETNTEKSDEFSESNDSMGVNTNNNIFIATGRLVDADLLREMSVVVDTAKNEFSSRHSLEWKFLFLDHRAPPIIGYLPFEVLGTSGYDYYHAEDLEKVATCHEALMQKGEGTSCFYRFLTKGQQWIWLQTRFYITYHQWNSKPEFIVCTHRVVSYADVMKNTRGEDDSLLESPQSGPPPKQSKLESKKFSAGAKHKNGNMRYGCVESKSGNMRKLDLPPKFVSALTSSNSVLLQPQKPNTVTIPLQKQHTVSIMDPIVSSICSQPLNTTVAVALHPQLTQFVQPQLIGMVDDDEQGQTSPTAAITLPVATFQTNPFGHTNQLFPISCSGTSGFPGSGPLSNTNIASGVPIVAATSPESQCVIQEQLLTKHAELQRQIMQQQDELRRVSEQLLLAQCGFIPGDASIIIPQSI